MLSFWRASEQQVSLELESLITQLRTSKLASTSSQKTRWSLAACTTSWMIPTPSQILTLSIQTDSSMKTATLLAMTKWFRLESGKGSVSARHWQTRSSTSSALESCSSLKWRKRRSTSCHLTTTTSHFRLESSALFHPTTLFSRTGWGPNYLEMSFCCW